MILATFGIVGVPAPVAQAGHLVMGARGSDLIHFFFAEPKGSVVKHISLNQGPHTYNLTVLWVHRLYAKIRAVVPGTDILVATGV